MVIDMLNMKKQIEWAELCYGRQSEEISDYTDLNLHLKLDEPRIVELRGAVDPYSYRTRYTLPKLLLLGTNDPYWTVDSLRHYWDDLPEPKLVFQTPNAGTILAIARTPCKPWPRSSNHRRSPAAAKDDLAPENGAHTDLQVSVQRQPKPSVSSPPLRPTATSAMTNGAAHRFRAIPAQARRLTSTSLRRVTVRSWWKPCRVSNR
jgi:hypothetical protein